MNFDLVFVSVEYREFSSLSRLPYLTQMISALTTEDTHPAQRTSFIKAYQHLLDIGVLPGNIVFMGDSADGIISPKNVIPRCACGQVG